MTRFRMRWNHRTGESYEVGEREGPAPKRVQIMRSLEPYQSPVTGEVIRSHSQRRAEMKEHGVIDARDAPSREEAANIRTRNQEENWSNHVRDLAGHFADR